MKYFIPEWDDRVDPKYDFINDLHSAEHNENPFENDAYIWDIFGLENVPIDGVLVSRMKIVENKSKFQQILETGIHEFLHLPKAFEVMGDCGAWGYADQEEPPFKTKEILDYYIKCGFDYGVSIDHLVVPAYREHKEKRWKITLDNAREMFELWQSKDEYLQSVRIIGVAQGWDVDSYKRAVKELLRIGYDYIGLGGLAKAPTGSESEKKETKTLLNVVEGTWLTARKWTNETGRRIDFHIFGVARLQVISELMKYGVTSFDSASFLRRAWLSARNNYFGVDGENYSAIRIPQASATTGRSPIKKNMVTAKLTELERNALSAMRSFDQGRRPTDEVVRAVLEYDRAIGERRDLEKYYKETLNNMPWKKCPCTICKEIGIDVIIFRGNNRNRRRGFHNTFVFYKKLREVSPRIFVFTGCIRITDERSGLLPAFQRYLSSSVFKIFWDNVLDLPVEVGVLSPKFGLVDWNKTIPSGHCAERESELPFFIEELKEKLNRYDKIFFIGLGLYKDVISKLKEETGLSIELFPKTELTEGEKLDILEYTKQMKDFRKAIISAIPEKCRPQSLSI